MEYIYDYIVCNICCKCNRKKAKKFDLNKKFSRQRAGIFITKLIIVLWFNLWINSFSLSLSRLRIE